MNIILCSQEQSNRPDTVCCTWLNGGAPTFRNALGTSRIRLWCISVCLCTHTSEMTSEKKASDWTLWKVVSTVFKQDQDVTLRFLISARHQLNAYVHLTPRWWSVSSTIKGCAMGNRCLQACHTVSFRFFSRSLFIIPSLFSLWWKPWCFQRFFSKEAFNGCLFTFQPFQYGSHFAKHSLQVKKDSMRNYKGNSQTTETQAPSDNLSAWDLLVPKEPKYWNNPLEIEAKY